MSDVCEKPLCALNARKAEAYDLISQKGSMIQNIQALDQAIQKKANEVSEASRKIEEEKTS